MLKKYMEEWELHVNQHLIQNGNTQSFLSYTENSSTHRTRHLVAVE